MIHLGIDPSVSCTGLARLDHRMYGSVAVVSCADVPHACASALRAVGDIIPDNIAPSRLTRPERAAWIEIPQAYYDGKADANDLIAIAAVSGAYASALSDGRWSMPVTFFRPAQWKGQVPKKQMDLRILATLTQHERAQLSKDLVRIPRGLQNNAMDALGIVLKGVGRL